VTGGLDALGGDLHQAVHAIGVPSYVIDASGIIRWINPAAERLVGDVRGRQFTSVVAPHETRRAREMYARKMIGGAQRTDAESMLIGADGGYVSVDISAVPLKDGHRIVGVFGQLSDVDETEEQQPYLADLTPRQAEILRLLEWGKSTEQIATELQLSQETVRNHIRRLFRALGVHTRLEAVARARFTGIGLEQTAAR
jgi:PAS domain S-box-containing protein